MEIFINCCVILQNMMVEERNYNDDENVPGILGVACNDEVQF